MANKMKQRWIAKDGSVFVAEPKATKIEQQKKPIMVQEPIAFNVGKEMAEYIANLHNEQLREDAAVDIFDL
jgi:hypothetical protein